MIIQPCIFCIYSYSVNFTEDGEPIYPLDVEDFRVEDDDNSFLLRATLTLENNNIPGVVDQLFASSNDRFNVSQNGTTQLVVDAVGPRRLITRQEEFVNFLRTVQFTTDDQAPDVVRNLSLVVEEFPIGEAPSRPFNISITIIPVNDRPILNSGRVVEPVIIDDYLSSNQGFAPSFLLSDVDVFDIDSRSSSSLDFIGLAVVSASYSDSLGVWQTWSDDESTWVDFPADLSDCYPVLVSPEMRIRFLPAPNEDKEDGVATIEYRVWDGSSDSSDCLNDTLQCTPGKSPHPTSFEKHKGGGNSNVIIFTSYCINTK